MGEPRNADKDFDTYNFLMEVRVFLLRHELTNAHVHKVLELAPRCNHHMRILKGKRPLSLRDAVRLAKMADLSLDKFIL